MTSPDSEAIPFVTVIQALDLADRGWPADESYDTGDGIAAAVWNGLMDTDGLTAKGQGWLQRYRFMLGNRP